MRASRLVLPLILGGILNSCFTGIESTPRITQKDVKRNNALESAEQSFAGKLTKEPFSQWRRGKRFLVVDSRLSMLVDGNRQVNSGDTLIYDGFTSTATITADTASILNFISSSDNGMVQLRLEQSPSAVAASKSIDVPFSIDFSLVNLADSLLRGKKLFVLSSAWIPENGTSLNGKKFIPVTIEKVTAGNDTYPLHVLFQTDGNIRSGIMMTAGPERTSTRNFDKIFSFEDPHLKYPQISEEMWLKIQNGTLSEGMTKEEARLSAGAPSDIKKGQDGTSYFERWTYENGGYIIFVDGILDKFRM